MTQDGTKAAANTAEKYISTIVRVSFFEGDITLYLEKGIPGIAHENGKFVQVDDYKKIRFTKRALVAQLCGADGDFSDFAASFPQGMPVSFLSRMLRGAEITHNRTFYDEGDVIPATEYREEHEAPHAMYTTDIESVKWSAKIQQQLDSFTDKMFDAAAKQMFS